MNKQRCPHSVELKSEAAGLVARSRRTVGLLFAQVFGSASRRLVNQSQQKYRPTTRLQGTL